MSESIYNGLIAEFEQDLTIDDYKYAYRLTELRHGASKGREWKASVFFAVAVGSVWYAVSQRFILSEIIMPALLLGISVYLCVYYLFILPSRTAKKAERIYKTSKYISIVDDKNILTQSDIRRCVVATGKPSQSADDFSKYK
ncbi:MAG: hypothetical protein IJU51_04685 [Clostridia bacterium]|nr:hypothetical protein [Clostridia bacterium]